MIYRRVVVATDFSEVSLHAVEAALDLEFQTGAILYVLHVLERPIGVDPIMGWQLPTTPDLYEETMDRLRAVAPEGWTKATVELSVAAGDPAHEIARFAREKEAELIVVGTHGRTGLKRLMVGSTAETLLREAPCRVLVLRPHAAAAARV